MLGHDTLVGPNYTLGDSASIIDLVLPHDEEGSINRDVFKIDFVAKMRAGESGSGVFMRTREDGKEEEVFLAYGPLRTWTVDPVNASDFSAGVVANDTHVYSIGFGITVEDLILPFTQVESQVVRDLDKVKWVSLALILVSVCCVLYMTYKMCFYISQPVLVLISIVKSIERKQLPDELPKLPGGSVEIYDVYDSLEKLCKIVRFTDAVSNCCRLVSFLLAALSC